MRLLLFLALAGSALAQIPASVSGLGTKIPANILVPTVDGTAAVQIMKADGATAVVTMDSTNGNLGVGALVAPPVAVVQAESSRDATNSNTASNFLTYLHYPASTNNAEAGLAFGVSSTASVGGAITLQRLGTGSYGNMHFYTLNVGQTYAKRMMLSAAGGLSIGNTTDAGSGNLLVNGTAISSGYNYIGTEGGATNAIAGTLTGAALADGLCVEIQLAHTLQAGANTFALNGGAAVGVKSHYNTANNIATAYAVTGRINLCYSSTLPAWVDMAQ